MFPIRDNIPSRTKPYVTYGIIAVTCLVFAAQLLEGDSDALVASYGMIPARVFHPDKVIEIPVAVQVNDEVVEGRAKLPPPKFNPWLTILTCVFLHGGLMHFLGNMWFLHIFGDNVEDRLGHVGYLLFYLACGVGASLTHLFAFPSSEEPVIGASGAIAGVMGAYFLLYPKAMVLSVVPIFFFVQLLVLPAPFFLGIWFLLQFLQGTVSITSVQTSNVAFLAHIGGFALGFVIALGLKAVGETSPPVTERRLGTDRITMHRW